MPDRGVCAVYLFIIPWVLTNYLKLEEIQANEYVCVWGGGGVGGVLCSDPGAFNPVGGVGGVWEWRQERIMGFGRARADTTWDGHSAAARRWHVAGVAMATDTSCSQNVFKCKDHALSWGKNVIPCVKKKQLKNCWVARSGSCGGCW